jgi:hypothetical protein
MFLPDGCRAPWAEGACADPPPWRSRGRINEMEDGTSSALLQRAIGSRSEEGDAGDPGAMAIRKTRGRLERTLGAALEGSPRVHWTRGGPAPGRRPWKEASSSRTWGRSAERHGIEGRKGAMGKSTCLRSDQRRSLRGGGGRRGAVEGGEVAVEGEGQPGRRSSAHN